VPKSIADVVRDKLDAGTLPLNDPVKLWADQGNGQLCAVCEQPILKSQVEYEPQYDDGQPAVHFHPECHGLWTSERQRRAHLPPIKA
jgi:hypothetical protein